MFRAKLTNTDLNITRWLTGVESTMQVVKIDGLAPVAAQVNTSSVVGMDGERFMSSKLEPRNIVITLRLNEAESARLDLEYCFPTKAPVQFYYDIDDRIVIIDGYVETFECDIFSKEEQAQISIICPDPYFRSNQKEGISVSSAGTAFPELTTIRYGIEISATIGGANVTSLTFSNDSTGESITIAYAFQAHDVLRINTVKGKRSVTLTRNGANVNVFGGISNDSTFFDVWYQHGTISYLVNGAADSTQRPAVSVTAWYRMPYAGV